MLMLDFRKPVTIWRTRWIITAVMIVSANLIGLLFLNFWETYMRVGIFTVTLPYILDTLWCSNHRDFRAVFNMATALFIGCVGTVTANLAELFLWDNKYFSLLVRIASFIVMFFDLPVLQRYISEDAAPNGSQLGNFMYHSYSLIHYPDVCGQSF